MRVSSAIRPFLSGTLKSTRTKARLPLRSTSLMESLSNSFFHQQPNEVDTSARITPLVVVPGEHLHEIAIHHLRVSRVDDRRIRIAFQVDGHEFVRRVSEDALQRTLGRALQGRVHFLATRLAVYKGRKVDDRDIGR